jgi:glutathione S-transferase
MKLYVFPVAPNPTRLMLYVAEKRAAGAVFDLEQVRVNLREKEQRTPEHLARNPLGKLPVLETDDGTFLTESVAIMHYLEELAPEPPMYGETPWERAQTLELERIVDIGILIATAQIVHATASPLGLAPNPAVAEHFLRIRPQSLALVEDRLSDGRPFLMGDNVTAPDCALAAALQFGRMGQIALEPAYKNIARWDTAFGERESAKQVLVL